MDLPSIDDNDGILNSLVFLGIFALLGYICHKKANTEEPEAKESEPKTNISKSSTKTDLTDEPKKDLTAEDDSDPENSLNVKKKTSSDIFHQAHWFFE